MFYSLLGTSGLAEHVLLMTKRETQENKLNTLASFNACVTPPNILLAKARWMAEPRVRDGRQGYVAKDLGMGELELLMSAIRILNSPFNDSQSPVIAPSLMLL